MKLGYLGLMVHQQKHPAGYFSALAAIRFLAIPVPPALHRVTDLKGMWVVGQLHSSLNGGSDGQGGMDELLLPPRAPPLDTDTPAATDALLDVDAALDP
jgi:hypothetical protein